MASLHSICIVFLAGTAMLLSGCGGGASGPVGDSSRAKQEVARAIADGFGVHRTGASSGNGGRRRRSEGPRFDEFHGLWKVSVENGSDYFEDEACTLPAGTDRYVRVYADNGSEFDASGSFSITAGPRAGAKGTSAVRYTLADGGLYTFLFEGNIPGYGSYRTSGRWDAEGGGYESYFEVPGEAPRTYKCFYAKDGTSTLSFTNQRGLEFDLSFAADRSGKGVVRGSEPGLFPGTVAWDAQGDGAVWFADGSRVEFSGFAFDGV